MKALVIGGTGTISSAVAELAVKNGWEVTILNRGSRPDLLPDGCSTLEGDIRDEKAISALLEGKRFDVVLDFLVFLEEEARQAVRLFRERTDQYIFVSSATVYQKPPTIYPVIEGSGRGNPFSDYARNKIVCEDVFLNAWRNEGFPCTVVRPSHTYGRRKIPVGFYGRNGAWQALQRMKEGRPVIVHGDGTSLWTLTHNTDFAKGMVGLMGNSHALGESYHITSDEVLSWNDVHQIIGKALGVEAQLFHVATDYLIRCDNLGYGLEGSLLGDKSYTTVMDNRKIKAAVPAFRCTTRFDQGVRECLAYYEDHPEEKQLDPEFDSWCDRVIESCQAGVAAFLKK